MGEFSRVTSFQSVNFAVLIIFFFCTNAVVAGGFSEKIDTDSVARGEVQVSSRY